MNEKPIDEHEYRRDDSLAKEAEWNEQEHFYEMERNKRLPAVIKIIIPQWKNQKRKPLITLSKDLLKKKEQ